MASGLNNSGMETEERQQQSSIPNTENSRSMANHFKASENNQLNYDPLAFGKSLEQSFILNRRKSSTRDGLNSRSSGFPSFFQPINEITVPQGRKDASIQNIEEEDKEEDDTSMQQQSQNVDSNSQSDTNAEIQQLQIQLQAMQIKYTQQMKLMQEKHAQQMYTMRDEYEKGIEKVIEK
jgi:hypothetical protein